MHTPRESSPEPQAPAVNSPEPAGEGFIEDVEQHFRWRDISLEGWICLPLFWILAGVVFWQFFTRYVLNDSAVWTEEIARQLLVILTFFGAGHALVNHAHIRIGFLVDRFTGTRRRAATLFADAVQFSFYGTGCLLCLDIARAMSYQRLMTFDVSKAVIYQAVAAALGLMALRVAQHVYRTLRGNPAEPREPALSMARGAEQTPADPS